MNGCDWTAGGQCPEPAVMLVQSQGMNDTGIMVLVMWDGWDTVPDPKSFYCLDHAQHILAGLPTLAPALTDTTTHGEVFTHG